MKSGMTNQVHRALPGARGNAKVKEATGRTMAKAGPDHVGKPAKTSRPRQTEAGRFDLCPGF